MTERISKNWIRFLSIGILLIASGLISRLYFLQIVSGEEFKEASNRQITTTRVNKNGNRGSIIFQYRDGRDFYAAVNKTTYAIEINPQIVKNPEDTYNILSSYVEIDPDEYFKHLSKKNDKSEIIAKRVPPDVAEEIAEIELKGVLLQKEKWRFYPGKNLASQLLGFMSYRGDEIVGQYGLERQYDEVLTKDDQSLYANFFVELFSGIKEGIGGQEGDGSVVTTIEPNLQTFVEGTISKVTDDWHSKKTGAIIMDPATGEIYALAVNPTYDANIFNLEEDVSIFNNDAVESVYEMGSIIKPLSVAIGLDTGSIEPQSTYYDAGSLTLNNRTFYNYDKKGRGTVDMQEVLNQSLNTGVAHISQKVGNKDFSGYMKKLLGNQTGVDLPNEAWPLVSNLDIGRDIEMATASFGQGVAVTPLSAIRALATLGNGGVLVKPHVVNEIRSDIGTSREFEPPDSVRVFRQETSEKISKMLTRVVDEALLNGEVALPNYSIAAKTGTAQIADETNGGYFEDRYLHSFFGYFPAYDPEFIVLLYTIEPKGVQYASRTLTAPFMDIVKYLINYYQVEPDR